MRTLDTFQERLKFIREHLKKNELQMANVIGVTTGTYTRWEKGTLEIRPFVLDALCERLSELSGYSVSWIKTGTREIAADPQ